MVLSERTAVSDTANVQHMSIPRSAWYVLVESSVPRVTEEINGRQNFFYLENSLIRMCYDNFQVSMYHLFSMPNFSLSTGECVDVRDQQPRFLFSSLL